MIKRIACHGAGKLSGKDMIANLAHPPVSDQRFWWAQMMVVLVFAVDLGAAYAQAYQVTPIPGHIWDLLLLIPVVYAGIIFGLVGSLGTAVTGIVAVACSELILPRSTLEIWGDWTTFAVILVAAIVLGVGFEEMRIVAKTQAATDILTKSEERFRLAFDDNMAAMAVADLDSHVLRVNRAFCEMLGRTEEELVGLNLLEFTHPEDRTLTESVNAQMASGGLDQMHYAKRYLHKSGALVFAEVSRSIVRDEKGDASMVIASVRDVTEEHALTAQLAHQAQHDPLTGLPNRALFQDRMAQTHARVRREGGRGALLMLDLDDFKGANDTLGHHIGDQLLVAVAHRLEKVVRSQDTLCRFGGDEFLYLAEGLTDPSEATEIAARLHSVFAEGFVIAGHTVKQSASIGIVVCDVGCDENWSELIQDVDTAMYEAKRQGKARQVLFDPQMRERTSNRFKLAQELSQALSHGEISMYYQPIVELANGEVVGYEALMRWQHPEFGWVTPSVFIPLAEQNDVIGELGLFALRHAISEAATWRVLTSNSKLPHVAINLSGRQFHDPNLLSTIEEILSDSGLDPERLVLEITESVALSNIESATKVIEHLKRLRISVALDDFGTGYSSLSYLTMLRPNIIKIDRSFVSAPRKSPYADRLLEAIISLCHVLETTVLAEGIETPAQLALLHSLGCELGQGYLFSPAVPVDIREDASRLAFRRWEETGIVSRL